MQDTYRLAGAADATGHLTLSLRTTGGTPWIIGQISPEMLAATTGTTGAVRLNDFLVSPFVPTADAVGGSPPITLQPGDELTITWSGAPAGAVGRALVIYDNGV